MKFEYKSKHNLTQDSKILRSKAKKFPSLNLKKKIKNFLNTPEEVRPKIWFVSPKISKNTETLDF